MLEKIIPKGLWAELLLTFAQLIFLITNDPDSQGGFTRSQIIHRGPLISKTNEVGD